MTQVRFHPALDEELLLHPEHAVGIRLGDDRTVGDDMLRDADSGEAARL
jgi:hypothetical protein